MLGTVQKVGEKDQSAFNAGFLTHVYLIRTEDITYQSDNYRPTLLETSNLLDIHADTLITQIRIKPKTATLSETQAENADGTSFGMNLAIPLKGPATSLADWVYVNMKRRFILFARDTMGYCYVAGKVDNGARVSWSRQIAGNYSHLLTISMVDWQPVRFIPTIDLEVLFPEGDFSTAFDFSFS